MIEGYFNDRKVLMNESQSDVGDIVGDSYLHFHGGFLMERAHININHIFPGIYFMGPRL